MDKQELKEKVKSLESFNPCTGTDFEWVFDVCRHEVLSLIQALDEPRKVKVPAFVDEWIEMNKAGDVPIMFILKYFGEWFEMSENKELNNETCEWVIRNPEKFMRAWLDGYEVEEEPKWVVNEGDLVIRKGEHEAKVYFVESVDDDGILLVNGIKDEFFTDLDDRSVGEESINYFYENFRLLAKKENLEVEKV